MNTDFFAVGDDQLEALMEDIRQGPYTQVGALWDNLWRKFESDDSTPRLREDSFVWELESFVVEHPTPAGFADGDPAWSIREAAIRLEKMLIFAAKVWPERLVLEAIVDHAEYLAAFHISRDTGDRLLAGSALALAGMLCTALPQSRQWHMYGLSRLATELAGVHESAEDESLVFFRDLDYDQIRARLNLSFKVTDEGFFDQLNLDYPGLDRVRDAVLRGYYDLAKEEYISYLQTMHMLPKNYFGIDEYEVDLKEADDICRNILVLRAHMHLRHDFGDEIDWTTVLMNDIESNVWLNAHPDLATLARAYYKTGDEKYAHHLARLFNSWYEQSPVPDVKGSKQWRTLEVGNRASLKWPEILFYAISSDEFREEALFNMAKSYMEHARYLSAHQALGGNWYQVETCGLGVTSVLFPEFKESPRFLALALRRLQWINGKSFFPDGFQTECSSTYHHFPFSTIASFYLISKLKDRQISEGFEHDFEKMVEVFVYLSQPNLVLPLLNDCNPSYVSVPQAAAVGDRIFDREDFHYMATSRKEGKPPEHTSYAFPYAGYYVMRDSWDEDAQYLVFDAGYYGAGHQHEDKLNFVLHAAGRTLIIDPGIYQYYRDKFLTYFKSSRGHNSVMVDGKGQARGLRLTQETVPDPETRWITDPAFDFALGWYRDGFARSGDRSTLETDIHHRRCIFHVRGEYYILRDLITSRTVQTSRASQSKRRLEQIFHLAPMMESLESEGFRPGEIQVRDDMVVRTVEPNLSNIAIIPVGAEGLELRDECGQTEPYVAGWTALYGKQPSHDVTYIKECDLPASLDDILFPLQPGEGEDQIPKVSRLHVRTVSGVRGTGIQVDGSGFRDIFVMSDDGAAVLETDEVSFSGEVLWLRMDERNQPVKAVMIEGRSLELDGQKVVDLPSLETLHLSFEGGHGFIRG
jgi:hypothetical protein